MDIGQIVQNAINVEQQGVPVNWKELCVTVLNAAVQRVRELEEDVLKYESHLDETPAPAPSLPTLDDL